MIYYTNTQLTLPHMAFIGRWSPFHKGHSAIIVKKISEQPKTPVLIMIRDTGKELYPATIRAEYIKTWMTRQHVLGTIMIIPNVEGIYWGRDVGYHTSVVDVDINTQQISGSKIRTQINSRKTKWQQSVAQRETAYMLSPSIAKIMTSGMVLWLTGCPSSGKTTIAEATNHELHRIFPHVKTQLLDGDTVRNSPLAAHVGFSKNDRAEHILRMAYLAKLFADHGIIVICAFVSPDRSIRKKAKKIVGAHRFFEIYVQATQKTRIKRDTKGLYKQASRGQLSNLTGFNAEYETPLNPDITCDTDKYKINHHVNTIITKITQRI